MNHSQLQFTTVHSAVCVHSSGDGGGADSAPADREEAERAEHLQRQHQEGLPVSAAVLTACTSSSSRVGMCALMKVHVCVCVCAVL